ncbi:Uncharacterised protein [Salmonella enterica subsp. enterica serovar Typhimurium str. DT104]|nr:Uncharacterised protein [Salmonella enterica subsp. enterica serovar Bovismorbificans]CQC12814.1 Uncharacterised protein [Salmonella enterica subsp. enterica serovar Typhimurium str. DT104]CQE29533.1 Uncharacterised protein [Salmonella enterica subsp. enterica serovar Typhimurium str. DT104]
MAIQQAQRIIQTRRIVIIQQQTNMNAALRRRQQYRKEQPPGHIVFPNIILHIQRPRRHFGQAVAGGKSVQTVIQRENAALSGMARA